MPVLTGCEEPAKEEAVVQAPPAGRETLPPFPEAQVQDPEPQPASSAHRTASPPAEAPPVDTTASRTQAKPNTSARPLPKENYPPAQPKAPKTYVVKQGDTLQKISRQFFNTNTKWRAIYEANRDVMTQGPDHLMPGMKLKIPG
jgi:nucleoid-associated protein YgaU